MRLLEIEYLITCSMGGQEVLSLASSAILWEAE